jgi:Domain of unknown function (DUF4430)
MTARRGTAVASALLALLAAAGCGLGPGADVGDVQLTVTRDYGAEPMLESSVAAKESDTVMRVLEGEAEIETRYGGGYVHSIEGLVEESRGGDPYDWFFYVDGEESEVGAADYEVERGERIWWDYRNWSAVNHAPAVVGSWPAPFVDGIGGKRYPVGVECMASPRTCELTREALEREGVEISDSASEGAIRVLVGPWDRVRTDATAELIESGPVESGVFARFEATGGGYELVGLTEAGEGGERLGPNAGLVAATSRYGGPPVWVVTGGTEEAVQAAAEVLGAEHLRDHYAVAVEGGETTPLPLEKP